MCFADLLSYVTHNNLCNSLLAHFRQIYLFHIELIENLWKEIGQFSFKQLTLLECTIFAPFFLCMNNIILTCCSTSTYFSSHHCIVVRIS